MSGALHRLVLRTRGVPGLRAAYRGAYAAAAAAAARSLARCPGVSSVTLHRGMTREGWEPGISDIDLLVELSAAGPEAEAAALDALGRRAAGLRRILPMLGDLWIGTSGEIAAYLRRGGLRAVEDPPDWRTLAGTPPPAAPCAESALKRRFLDPWVWALVSHMDVARRVFRPGAEPAAKREVDLRKLYLDFRRCADFVEADGARPLPETRAEAARRLDRERREPPEALWLDSAVRLESASRRVLRETGAGPEREPAARWGAGGPALEALLARPALAVVADPPYHSYLLLGEGAVAADFSAAARRARDPRLPGVPLILGPAAWSLALQSAYLGAPLGRLGSGAGGGPEAGGPPFAGWEALAVGRPPAAALLPGTLRREIALEAAAWMRLWWRALWLSPAYGNRFVLHHLVTRAAGLRLELEGLESGPFSGWELQLARLAAAFPGERASLARLCDALRDEPEARWRESDRSSLSPALRAGTAALLAGLSRRVDDEA